MEIAAARPKGSVSSTEILAAFIQGTEFLEYVSRRLHTLRLITRACSPLIDRLHPSKLKLRIAQPDLAPVALELRYLVAKTSTTHQKL